MSTRLISFLSDIERALAQQPASTPGMVWEVTRMVSYHNNLARMILAPQAGPESGQLRGSISLQSFLLADGSLCLKATLGWESTEAHPVISVYSKPLVDWPAEAARIAGAWLAGPAAIINSTHAPQALFAVAS